MADLDLAAIRETAYSEDEWPYLVEQLIAEIERLRAQNADWYSLTSQQEREAERLRVGEWQDTKLIEEQKAEVERLRALCDEQGRANGRLASWNVEKANKQDAVIAAMRPVVEAAVALCDVMWYPALSHEPKEKLLAAVAAYRAAQEGKP